MAPAYKQLQNNTSIWVISEVVVDKQHQNKGYGKELMQSALNDIIKRDGQFACMIVLKNNNQARNLYENKLSFRVNPKVISGDHQDLIGLSLKL